MSRRAPKCSEKSKSTGKRCRRTALQGTKPPRCVSHSGAAGRKSILSESLTDDLVRLLAAGNYLEIALDAIGLGRSTFYEWLERGELDEGGAKKDEAYRKFRERIEKARAEGEARNVTVVAAAAAEDWKAAAWMLERQFPERWGRVPPKDRSSNANNNADADVAAEEQEEQDPFAALEGNELAQRRAKRRGA
jgi:transposase